MSSEPTPAAQHAEVFGRNNVIVQIQGDGNTVVLGLAHLELTRHLHLRRAKEKQARGISGLLSPYTYSILFIGRDDVVADLWRWMERGDRPISIRVLVAPGGSGKTRLALELCDQAAARSWNAGFVTDSELKRFFDKENLSTWGWNKPTLLVIDYAASKAQLLGKWLSELAGSASEVPLRLLLLERRADPSMEWWGEAFGRGGRHALEVQSLLDPEGGPYVLPHLPAEYRRRVFEATLQEVGASVLDSPQLDRRLGELSWGGEPLFLMMAALMSVQTSIRDVLALKPTDIAFRIAEDFELDRIRKIASSRGIAPDFLAHMAAYVTLCQGLSRSQTEEAIEVEKRMLRYDSVGDPPRIYQALHDALPGDGSDVSPVLPNILGEAVTLAALGAGDPAKAEDAVIRAAVNGGEKALAAMVRTADDFGSVRKEALDWLRRWVRDGEGDDERIMYLSSQLPQKTLALREFAADLMASLVERFRRSDLKNLLATGLNNLSIRLSDLGCREEALAAMQEAVFLYRGLVSVRPEAFRPALASSLNNLANRLSDQGRREEALEASQESVSLYQYLASVYPEAFRADLAMALDNLAGCLSSLGFWEEALAADQEAVSLYRSLVSAHPGAFRSGLAMSLNNLANRLSALGLREEAMTAGQEAVSLYRELASTRPEAFQPDLASSLGNLANRLSDLGCWGEALEASQEAVSLSRDLASVRPEVFNPALANSLSKLANCLSDLRRWGEALEVGQEAVALYQELASAHPEAFRPDLANSLNNLPRLLSALGYWEKALEVGKEAVSLYRELASVRPGAFRPELAGSLNNLANLLSHWGLWEEALDASQEAVLIRRDLASAHPEAFRPDLAGSLFNLSLSLGETGQIDRAVEPCREAVELLIPFFLSTPAVFGEQMVNMVDWYLYLVQEIGHQPDSDLLAPLVEVGFLEIEPTDSTSPDETIADPEEEPR